MSSALLLVLAAVAPVDAFLQSRDRVPLPPTPLVERGLVSSVEPRFGVPTFYWAEPQPGAPRLKEQGLSAVEAARQHLLRHAALYRVTGPRLAEAPVRRVHELHDGGAVIVSFGAQAQGVDVFRHELRVVMTADYALVALAGSLPPATAVAGTFRLADEQAIAAAHQALSGRGLEPSQLKPLGSQDGYRRYGLDGEATPVRVRPVHFALPKALVPSLYVELRLEDADEYAAFVISAEDGRVLFANSLVAADAFSYRVWADAAEPHFPLDGPQGNGTTPHPTGRPGSLTVGWVAPALITLAHGPLLGTDPWLAPGAQDTRGNNARAYIDAVRPNGYGTGDLLPTVTAPGVFDRAYDPDVNPDVSEPQRLAAATQLFYDVNWLRDWYYDLGFDEAAGNAQQSNLGRGGRAGDPLLAEGQDNSGTNNANMSTPADGASPIMQMYIFRGPRTLRVQQGGRDLAAGAAQFGPQTFNLPGTAIVASDGTSAPSLGCGAGSGWVGAAGKIVIVDRGTCTFAQKVENAQAAGALGVVLADNTSRPTPPDLFGTSATARIPVLSVTRTSGTALKTAAGTSGTPVVLERTASSDRDGTIDNGIIAHEWGHYIAGRLVGDGNGLSNNQARGMGEGWSDFHALLLTVRAEDAAAPNNQNWTGTYAVGGYTSVATDPNGYYFGVRRVPYSTSFDKNGLMFRHIQAGVRLPPLVPTQYGQDGAYNAETHSTGEVWATMLWECYVALLRDSRFTFGQAQDRMRRTLVAAYKATPEMPTFIDARDALLAAAAARDMADFSLFYEAFARRGMGLGAVAPARDSQDNTPVVESTLVGGLAKLVGWTLDDSRRSCDHDGLLDNDEDGLLTVRVRNTGSVPLSSLRLSVASSQAGLVVDPAAPLAFPAIAPFATATLALPVTLRGLAGTQPLVLTLGLTSAELTQTPAPVEARFRLNYDVAERASATDDVEAPTSAWTVANNPNGDTGSDWRIFASSPTEHFWFGPNASSPADLYLVSPRLEVGTGAFAVTWTQRWDFEFDGDVFFDGGAVELSTDDGATWVDAASVGTLAPAYNGQIDSQSSNPLRGRQIFGGRSTNYPAFLPQRLDLGTRYQGRTVRLRFRIGTDDAAAAKGWELDDVGFEGLAVTPFSAVRPDLNTCTNAAPTLNVPATLTVDEGTTVTLPATTADANDDPVTVHWTQTGGAAVALEAGRFVAPKVTQDVTLRFAATATDGKQTVGPANLDVTVRDTNRAPTLALEPARRDYFVGEAVTLSLFVADADGDPVTLRAELVEGPVADVAHVPGSGLVFIAPPVEKRTTLTLQVVASDGAKDSEPARVTVVVRPQTACGCGAAPGGLWALALLALWRRQRTRR